MILQIMGGCGFAIIGYLLPEFFTAIGGNKCLVPVGQNILCSLSFIFISAYFIFN